ncbi:MmcQ/YjbR family DNA-binding protein [Brevibacterium sp. W7.2]|uniref:MmcQ/YjbR family DNA-binding protein n=1 Tax=Brevibacterium sp. W7.2 TaxID=2823518 RepID=UPI0020113E9F|nr:MmcQ/YjbR family DNA-binding protein [Brevibacterium sp. W7.2]
MAHAQMFDDDDPVLARFRTLALGYPAAQEKVSHGRPAFFTKKVFAYFGGTEKHVTGQLEQHPHAVLLLLDPLDAEVMLERNDTFVPMYLGPTGWIGIDIDDLSDEELRELLTDSYRNTAPTRLARLAEAEPEADSQS